MLRVPLLRGRVLDRRDAHGAPLVAVINRTAAEELFPGEDPLGLQIMLGAPTAPARTIVGIVGDVRHRTVQRRDHATSLRAASYMCSSDTGW